MVQIDIGSQTKPGFTGLMQNAGKGDVPRLTHEIAAGGDVNSRDETGWTALMTAASAVQAETVSLLLKNDAQVDLTHKNGDTALIAAAANPTSYWKSEKQISVVQQLIAAGANVETTNLQGETPLM
jgi:ankyrin repeat protein